MALNDTEQAMMRQISLHACATAIKAHLASEQEVIPLAASSPEMIFPDSGKNSPDHFQGGPHMIRCIGCGRVISKGHEIRRLTYEPGDPAERFLDHRAWDAEPLVGYAHSERCGREWMADQRDRADLLRIVVSQTTMLSEVG